MLVAAFLAALASASDPWAAEKARVEDWVRRGKGTISFLHVHKGGGTTMCELARANGMRTQRNVAHSAAWAGHNCNPTKEDAFDANKGLPEAAVAYAARMRGSGAAAGVVREGAAAPGGGGSFFFANEGRLPAALAFGSFAFVAVIREPLRLAVSLYGAKADAARLATYNNRQLSLFIGCAASVQRLVDAGKATAETQLASFEYGDRRRLAREKKLSRPGDAARGLPTGRASDAFRGAKNSNKALTRAAAKEEASRANCDQSAAADLGDADLAAAKLRVGRFSLVVPTERLRDAMPLFEAKFGWRPRTYARAGTHKGAASDYDAGALARVRSDPALAAAFAAASALDRDLYAYALAAFEAQLAALAPDPPSAAGRDRVAVLGTLRDQGLLAGGEYDAALRRANGSRA